jgi:hypothetical protein
LSIWRYCQTRLDFESDLEKADVYIALNETMKNKSCSIVNFLRARCGTAEIFRGKKLSLFPKSSKVFTRNIVSLQGMGYAHMSLNGLDISMPKSSHGVYTFPSSYSNYSGVCPDKLPKSLNRCVVVGCRVQRRPAKSIPNENTVGILQMCQQGLHSLRRCLGLSTDKMQRVSLQRRSGIVMASG